MENQQKKPVMAEISQDYKKLEKDVYDYAYFLQCSPELSSKTWEPHPFRLMEKYMNDDMEHVLHDISSQRFTVEEKCEKMKEFVEASFRKFKRKDDELVLVVQDKTDAILTFVEKMRMWVANYEIKRDFLGGLRKEFVADSTELSELIDHL